jgi:hypothetical protein
MSLTAAAICDSIEWEYLFTTQNFNKATINAWEIIDVKF